MNKVTPFLWYDGQAEEAARFYCSIIRNSKIGSVTHKSDDGVISVTFELDGREFIALNGGPMYPFTPAFSMFVSCNSQAEVDELWEKLLSGGGQPDQCGWLRDRYGLSWQIIPSEMSELLFVDDPQKSARVMQAMLAMQKIDINALKSAAGGL